MFLTRAKGVITKGLSLVGLGTVATKLDGAQEGTSNLIVIGIIAVFAVLILRR